VADDFRLLMVSAMYENGGNTTHRFLDGHPQMFVYPFESQLGTRYVNDHLSSMFPAKYRWPVFRLDASIGQDYAAIIDEECKVRARTPNVSKFRHMPFAFSDSDRGQIYSARVQESGRTRRDNIAAFFTATFEAWTDYRRTGEERVYVGYSPIVVVDAAKILEELPDAHVLHVVRNPWSAYADTKKRAVPLSLEHYILGWTINQYYALEIRRRNPDRMHIVKIEDVMADSARSLGEVCAALGLSDREPALTFPSWNGQRLEEVYPWGTIRRATPEANLATALELDESERVQIRELASPYIDVFGYETYMG
jgi:Sulfotransferase family